MLIVFQRGKYFVPNSMVSATNRRKAPAGKYTKPGNVLLQYVVLNGAPSLAMGIPFFSAATMYMAQIMAAGH